jgi:hypothetical protein
MAEENGRKKTSLIERGFLSTSVLLQLGFLVCHMFASLGIVLLDLHFLGHGLLVLGGGIEVTGAGSRFEFDLFTHG